MEKVTDSQPTPILYIVAGPPGVGKTTNAPIFLPSHVTVLNHDAIEMQYKNLDFMNYSDRATEKMWELIHQNIAINGDFGIELNLGCDEHYKGLEKIHSFCKHYEIHVVLFFTDIYHLCLNRAAKREFSGGHEVEPAVIEEMRYNTIPLFKKNIEKMKHITFIDVTYNSVKLVYSGYYPNQNHEYIHPILPDWVTKFIEIV